MGNLRKSVQPKNIFQLTKEFATQLTIFNPTINAQPDKQCTTYQKEYQSAT